VMKIAKSLLKTLRRDFAIFITEHDKRRQTNFEKVFSEIISDFNEWKKIPEQNVVKNFVYKLILR